MAKFVPGREESSIPSLTFRYRHSYVSVSIEDYEFDEYEFNNDTLSIRDRNFKASDVRGVSLLTCGHARHVRIKLRNMEEPLFDLTFPESDENRALLCFERISIWMKG